MSSIEIATGLIFGMSDRHLPPAPPHTSPRAALEAAIRPLLANPPCLVSFSGGRDSSAILATCVNLARREGLETPVAVTLRYPDVPRAEESAWQELVITHLRLGDWHRLEIDGELDAIGPVARSVLSRHGLLWPSNAYANVPMLEAARGGTLLTGLDGDGLFGDWRWEPLARVLRRRVRPVPRDLLRACYALLPGRIRVAVEKRRRHETGLGWLTPDAERLLRHLLATEEGQEPVEWNRRVAWWSLLRQHDVLIASLALLADDAGAAIAHPFLDPAFLAAVGRQPGRTGYGGRTAAMGSLFGDLLPEALIERRSKGWFDEVFWGPEARAFVKAWDGRGVDTAFVDPQALQETWSAGRPHACSGLLLQSAWLFSHRAEKLE